MRQFFLALGCFVFFASSVSTVHAQTQTPTAINPLTGPSFPCPKPEDPLAQLFCTSPQLALLDMQFVKTYDALHQQIGPSGDEALRQEDIQLELTIRSRCGIAMPQGNSPTPPPPAPPGSDQCVIAAYQQQIAIWKNRLSGAAAEEANRSIQGQIALQARLQALGFLSPQAQLDSVFGSGTRAAIIQWQNSVGRPPTGILGDADAQALLSSSVGPQTTGSDTQTQSLSIAQSLAINPAPLPPKSNQQNQDLGASASIAQSLSSDDNTAPASSQPPAAPMSNDSPAPVTINPVSNSQASNPQAAQQPPMSQPATPATAQPPAPVPPTPRVVQQDGTGPGPIPSSPSIWQSIYSFFIGFFDEIEDFFSHLFRSTPPPAQVQDLATKASTGDAGSLAKLEQYANGGVAVAQYDLGVLYHTGQGVLQDDDQAVQWFQKAAQQGFVLAEGNLGLCYQKGLGVAQDDTQAVYWFEKAAAQGSAQDEYRLGDAYRSGNGVQQNYVLASQWLDKSAEQGDASAQGTLGVMYALGLGISKNNTEALKWFLLSKAQLTPGTSPYTNMANSINSTLTPQMTTNEIADAQQEAETWAQNHPSVNENTSDISAAIQSSDPGNGDGDSSSAGDNSGHPYTLTINCLFNGQTTTAAVCLAGPGPSMSEDTGGIQISDGDGNQNFGAVEFYNHRGQLTIPLTKHFEINAQEGGFNEQFQLEVKIEDGSGNTVYDNKTVSDYQTISVSN